jgi:toxin ParE1/3/4
MRLRWTDPAQTDFDEILAYIARVNPAAAERVGRRLLTVVASLAQQPRLGRPGRVAGTRELVIPRLPYLAIYRVVEASPSTTGTIEVLRVIHGARRWPAQEG